jgi:ribonuclease J
MHSIVQSEWFVPVHGEYRHMAEHARIAVEMGQAADRVVVCSDGDAVLLTDDGLTRTDRVSADYIYIAGSVGALDHSVLIERRILGREGFVSAIVPISIVGASAELLREPEILSRGWVDGDEGDLLRKEATLAVREAVEEALGAGKRTRDEIERVTRRALGRFINRRTRLRPMVVPVVLGAYESGGESAS